MMDPALIDLSEHDGSFILDLDNFEKGRAQDKFKILQEMFPDAETFFLEAKSAELALDNIGFDYFLENTMIRGLYPKKVVQQEVSQQEVGIKYEFEPFDVESFLKKYSDPEDYFTYNARGARYLHHSVFFLQKRYVLHSAMTVRSLLQRNNFNMFLASKELELTLPTRKIPRRATELKKPLDAPPIEFLDEATFIENYLVIRQFMKDKTTARNLAVEEARKTLTLLTCGCCFNDELLGEDVSHCSEGHIFCKKCIERSTEIQMGDGKLDFPCLRECTGFFSANVLKEILPQNTFEILEKKFQEREIASANIPGLVTCIFCGYSAILPDEVRIFQCENCRKEMCRLCKKESHIPFTCKEVEERDALTKDRLFVEERMTEALLRKCWKCGAKFIREDGCNKMTCVCGAMMCYICRQPVKDYKHFEEKSRTGRNGTTEKRCPLWTNNESLHRQEVNEEGNKAIDNVKRRNTELEKLLYQNKKCRLHH